MQRLCAWDFIPGRGSTCVNKFWRRHWGSPNQGSDSGALDGSSHHCMREQETNMNQHHSRAEAFAAAKFLVSSPPETGAIAPHRLGAHSGCSGLKVVRHSIWLEERRRAHLVSVLHSSIQFPIHTAGLHPLYLVTSLCYAIAISSVTGGISQEPSERT